MTRPFARDHLTEDEHPCPRRPRWERFLSEISEWDQRFKRDRAPWIELAAGLAALTVVAVSLLAAGEGNAG